MFVRNGEDVNRLRKEQGLRAWEAELRQNDDPADRVYARARIAELKRELGVFRLAHEG